MPVSRRRAKGRRARITPEAAAAFRNALEHRETYFACIGGAPCKSNEVARHCADCRTYIDEHSCLDRLLGVRPWEASPLDVSADEPDPVEQSYGWAASIPQARQWRAELEAANITGNHE